jgi:hypothetical protein
VSSVRDAECEHLQFMRVLNCSIDSTLADAVHLMQPLRFLFYLVCMNRLTSDGNVVLAV